MDHHSNQPHPKDRWHATAVHEERGAEMVEWIAMVAAILLLLLAASSIFNAGGATTASGINGAQSTWADKWVNGGNGGGSQVAIGNNGSNQNGGNQNGGTQNGGTQNGTGGNNGGNGSGNDRGFLDHVGGFLHGVFIDGAWNTVTGIVGLGRDVLVALPGTGHIIDWFFPGIRDETFDKYAQLWEAIKNDPLGALYTMVEPMVTAWNNGEYGRAIGMGIFEIGMIFVPGDEVGKIGKIDKLIPEEVITLLRRIDQLTPDELARAVYRMDLMTPEEIAALERRLQRLTPEELERLGLGIDDAKRIKPCSFSAATLVVTEEGKKPISQIAVGERVLALNAATGIAGYYVVYATMSHEDPIMVSVMIEGDRIETTPPHPFFVVKHVDFYASLYPPSAGVASQGEWVEAVNLEVGDQILNAAGQLGSVESIEFVARSQMMYDLTVETAHSFSVGDGDWFVHNCPVDPNDPAMFDAYKRSQAGYKRPEGQTAADNCPYCGRDLDPNTARKVDSIEWDHLLGLKDAWERGGKVWTKAEWETFANDLDNLVQACKSCNASKQAKRLFDEWAPPNITPAQAAELQRRIEETIIKYGLNP